MYIFVCVGLYVLMRVDAYRYVWAIYVCIWVCFLCMCFYVYLYMCEFNSAHVCVYMLKHIVCQCMPADVRI